MNADHDHERYITTQEFKKLTSEIFAIRLANEEVTSNKSKDVLDENELKKITDIDSSLFINQSYFLNDRVQLYLIF